MDHFSRLNQRKLKSVAFYLIGWLLQCGFFVVLRYSGRDLPIESSALYAGIMQFALLCGLSQGLYEVYVLSDNQFRRTRAATLVVRTLFYLSMIFANLLVIYLLWAQYNSRQMISERTLDEIKLFFNEPEIATFIVFAFCGASLLTFVRSILKKFGPRVLINSILGKFQDPLEEERVFMFIDLKSATTLGEVLGHIAYSSFLRDYFHLVSNICVENGGEIYQFAGDGVILTWSLSSCRRSPKPIICHRDLLICFQKTRSKFEQKYKSYPQFKSAIHVGRVVATEVGNFGSELAYHGDALNTTARLQSLCNLLKKDLLISETFLRKIPDLKEFKAVPEGSFQLRGKSRELEVYSIDAMAQQ